MNNQYFPKFSTIFAKSYIFADFKGGIGDAVAEVVCEKRDIVVKKMCVREVPRSGPPLVLLEKFGIGTECIVKGVEEMKDW